MRATNRVVAALVALALALALLVSAVELVLAYANKHYWVAPWPRWYRNLRHTAWEATGTRVAFGILIAVGLLLLLLQLLRRPEATLALQDQPGLAPAVVRRRHLERALSSDAAGLDGVSSARAKVGRGRFHVAANTNRIQPKELENELRESVTGRVTSLGLAEPLPVSVDLRHRTPPNAQSDGRVQ